MTNHAKRAPVKPASKKGNAPSVTISPSAVAWIAFMLVLAFISFIRFRLSSFPLERDEGEYAYFGQLILDGMPPYKMAYNLKFPGTYYCYAMIMAIFGQTIQGIRFGLLLFDLGTLVFLYLTAKKLFNPFTALIAVITCGLLLTGPAVLGQAAHATHFVTFFMMAGTWLLVQSSEKGNLLFVAGSGILMGMAFLMKQSGIFFPVFGGLVIIARMLSEPRKKPKRVLFELLAYGAGVAIPVAFLFILMSATGVFDKFWFWTITYPGEYGSRIPLSRALGLFLSLFPMVTAAYTVFWILAGMGVVALFIPGQSSRNRIFVILFLVMSFLPAVPGFYFRNHYFVTILPAVGLLTGVFFDTINRMLEKRLKQVVYMTAGIFGIIVLAQLNIRKDYLFVKPPVELCRDTYRGNLFVESIEIAKYIAANSSGDDKIFVLGSEPQVYFYSKRKSATGYIYMYDLAFIQKYVSEMQKEMQREVEVNDPKYIVYCSSPSSWNATTGVTDSLFHWFNSYLAEKKFIPVGYADYRYPDPTVFVWGSDAATFRPQSQLYMAVLRKTE
jgi:hypothetical protein